jgi:hypothetical protein
MVVEGLKQKLDDAQRAATQDHATALTTAFRTGAELPAIPVAAPADSAPLTAALAHLNAQLCADWENFSATVHVGISILRTRTCAASAQLSQPFQKRSLRANIAGTAIVRKCYA